MNYGYWAVYGYNPARVGAVRSGAFGYGFWGLETAAAAMPSGSASYAGEFVGLYLDPGLTGEGRIGDMTGAVALTADFDAQTVDGAITGIAMNVRTAGFSGGANYAFNDIYLSATISGSSYAGEATTGAPKGLGFAEGLSGPLDGAFHGPGAEETGGVLTIHSNDTFITGSYGAAVTP